MQFSVLRSEPLGRAPGIHEHEVEMRHIVLLFSLAVSLPLYGGGERFHGRLMVSPNGHFLQCEDHTPFFWLGDTGWELIHRLTREEALEYLRMRKDQGFNVIQTVLLSEFDGLTEPNAYGALPLAARDPLKLCHGDSATHGQYGYWDHAEYIITQAELLGMYMALLPCWGEYVIPREGRQIINTRMQAYAYGNTLGAMFRHHRNIIWVLGGDRLPDERPDGADLWRALAKGIADGTNGVDSLAGPTDYSTTFMTYHCYASSSQWFQHDPWLKMNMWGSYHSDYSLTRAYEQASADWMLAKPTLNGNRPTRNMR